MADWLALPPARGGLDLGDAAITAGGVGLLAIGVAMVQSRTGRQTVVNRARSLHS